MNLSQYIKGDKLIWGVILVLSIFSILTVYSASSNLSYIGSSGGGTFKWLFKHSVHLSLGIVLMYFFSQMNYKYLAPISKLIFPFVIALLIYTILQGTTMSNANASRWITIPFFGGGVSFQTSSLATLVLIIYLSRTLSKIDVSTYTFKETFLPLLLPVGLVCMLVVPANFSTAAIIFILSSIVLYAGGYPLKYLLYVVGIGIFAFALLITVLVSFNISNRFDTWKARIENFGSENAEDNYQVNRAKMAIAMGGLFGQGPGKSVLKNFLPQSSSDFIYAILIEEYGIIGGLVILGTYTFFLIRILVISIKANSKFGSLIVIGLGSGIIIQALINMGVVVNLFPVTGQTLPLISAGGSSIWITCISIGMILSVSQQKKSAKESELNEDIIAINNNESHEAGVV